MATTSETLEILSKVNEFYNSSWDKLIQSGAIAFGIIGIVVPLIIQFYQTTALRLNKKDLESKISTEIEVVKSALIEEMTLKISEKTQEMDKKMEEYNYSSKGLILHLQANQLLLQKNYFEALRDYCDSTHFQLKGNGDILNVRSLFVGIKTCLDNLSKKDIEDLKSIHSIDLVLELNKIQDDKKNEVLLNDILEVKAKIINLK